MNAPRSADEAAILAINDRIQDEETRGKQGMLFFSTLLNQTLSFRRASGAVVTREEFLIDLADPANRRDRIAPVGEPVCRVYENTAVVSVLLDVVGVNGEEPIDGVYRNIRIFHRHTSADPWHLMVWFNDRIGDRTGTGRAR